MTDERAMEILNPEHREHYENIDIVNEACRIGMEAICKVKELKSENVALSERLEKAVELPCNVGDTIYSVFEFPKEKTVLKGTCNHIDINICGGFPEIFTKCVFETNEMILPRIYSGKALNNIFLTKQEAEARLAELKGGKE